MDLIDLHSVLETYTLELLIIPTGLDSSFLGMVGWGTAVLSCADCNSRASESTSKENHVGEETNNI